MRSFRPTKNLSISIFQSLSECPGLYLFNEECASATETWWGKKLQHLVSNCITTHLPFNQMVATLLTTGCQCFPSIISYFSWVVLNMWQGINIVIPSMAAIGCIASTCHGTLLSHHNGRNGFSNHLPHECVLNRSFKRRWKKTSKLRVTGLCAEISALAHMTSNAEFLLLVWINSRVVGEIKRFDASVTSLKLLGISGVFAKISEIAKRQCLVYLWIGVLFSKSFMVLEFMKYHIVLRNSSAKRYFR